MIIKSVKEKDGKWVGEGRFGATGKGLGRVRIEVDTSGGHPAIRFATQADATIHLNLLDDAYLVGTINYREIGGTLGTERALKLEKQHG